MRATRRDGDECMTFRHETRAPFSLITPGAVLTRPLALALIDINETM